MTNDELVKLIEREHDKVDLIFLGVGQPRQEEILSRIEGLEGKLSVVCCGAFWLQELKFEKGISKIAIAFRVVPFTRFYRSPFELFKRTILSVPFMFKKLR